MKNKILLFIILINSIQLSYSQITIGSIEKKKDTVILRPEPYDSLKNLVRQERVIDYKQYIGLQLYLPPFSNPKISSYQSEKSKPFIFSIKPNIVNIDTTQKELKINQRWHQSSIPGRSIEINESIKFDKIYTYTHNPFHYNTSIRRYEHMGYEEIKITVSNHEEVSDKYYTILDVIYGEEEVKLWKKMRDNLDNKEKEIANILKEYKDDFSKNNESSLWNENTEKLIIDKEDFGYKDEYWHEQNIVFMLRDDKSNDTVYTNKPMDFILVPYFVKQKQMNEGKTFLAFNTNETKSYDISMSKTINIPTLSKWICSVDILNTNYKGEKTDEYTIYYVLRNNEGETILTNKLSTRYGMHFIEENNYLKQKADKEINKEQLNAKKKQEELIRKEIKEKERIEHLKDCIDKFGKSNGELIAHGKVKIGMTKEMCQVAWGAPYWKDKITTENRINEDWYYGFGFSLHFENDILKMINE